MTKIQNPVYNDDMVIYHNEIGAVNVVYKERGLANLQLYGNKLNDFSYQEITEIQFNSRQQRLFKRLLYGINSIPKPELATLSKEQTKVLIKKHRTAQKIINRLKNEVVAAKCDRVFKKFWNSDLAKEMLVYSKKELNAPNTMTFKQLGISKSQIADKLVEHGLLPVNFYQLSA